MPAPRTAYLVIADITGYTRFLAQVELDHAHDIIGDLMTTIVKSLRPPLRLAKFEGDAALMYGLSEKVDGPALQDAIEAAYGAFHRRLRDIRRSTTCDCRACAHTSSLDLKFVCHHGELVEHVMAGRKEIAGRDVIIVHRFLKNEVAAGIGHGAYALYSDACVSAMGVTPAAQGLAAHTERVDLLGEVACWVSDLRATWQAAQDARRTLVERDGAFLVVARDLPAPPAIVWEHLTVPRLRALYQHTDSVTEVLPRGRRGAGATNHCAHGADTVLEEVLDWRPATYLTLTTLLPMPGAAKILMSFVLDERAEGGTHLELRVAPPKPRDASFLDKVRPGAVAKFTSEFEALAALLGRQAWTDALVPEPALPAPRV